jgi:hypothetical protein
MNYPVAPTEYQKDLYQPEWHERDFFHSPDGIQEFPDHHCKMTWLTSLPFIQEARNAIDIGCRDGEYTRYLFNHFQHVYCFDPRFRKYFPFNVDLTKITHFRIPLGDGPNPERLGRGTGKNMTDKVFYCLDDFNLQNIDYIKIDTDGYEMANIKGGLKTITRDWPIIVLEVFFERETLKYVTEELGYKIKAICPRGWDHVLVKE